MELRKLFEIQGELDSHIEKIHPRAEGEKRLEEKILALQTELGEIANEWRKFKFWSNDRKPRTDQLIEEYVDGLHFVLSIGLEESERYEQLVPIRLGLPDELTSICYETTIQQFNYLFFEIGRLYDSVTLHEVAVDTEVEEAYENIVRMFIGLGEKLGFTEKEIVEAYMRKNMINHERQKNGY
ncbi:dUTP diphosphatase [Geobacillus stearothermophilus]|uniref:dUTP diphosphatase n=1 Tax=Geobacillus stearothermophilus TaxID=1422 RepID=UPI002E216991|nr:dUTP diphosphatase [Geobacillus stearothermophilus]MED3752242.1 dUTP diphosphatase [Geobacillus stearothermophilus]